MPNLYYWGTNRAMPGRPDWNRLTYPGSDYQAPWQPEQRQDIFPSTTRAGQATASQDPASRYRVGAIELNPDLAKTMRNFRTTLDAQWKRQSGDFSNMYDKAMQELDQSYARQKEISGMFDPSRVEAQLGTARAGFGEEMRRIGGGYRTTLEEDAAKQREIQRQREALAGGEYQRVMDELTNRIMGQARQAGNINALTRGTPTSLGSASQGTASSYLGRALWPVQRELVERKFNLLDQGAGLERDIANREVDYLRGFEAPLAERLYGAESGDIRYITSLAQEVSNMPMQQAIQYLQSKQIPAAMINQIMGQYLNLTGAAQDLEDRAVERYVYSTEPGYLTGPQNYYFNYPENPLPLPGSNFAERTAIPQSLASVSSDGVTNPNTPGGLPAWAALQRAYLAQGQANRMNALRPEFGTRTESGMGYSVNPDGTVNQYTPGVGWQLRPAGTQFGPQ